MLAENQARCSNCGAANDPTTTFCGSCGKKFVAVVPAVADEEGVYHCYKHRREVTRVTCGRCERPICPKCLVVGPAGVRCKVCAKGRVPLRLRGVAHNAVATIGGIAPRRIWIFYIWGAIIRFIASLFGRW